MKKGLKIAIIAVSSVIGAVVLGAGAFVGYVLLSYNRIGDTALEVDANSTAKMQVGTAYKAMSYNIGFGAYSQDYTFFMDTGYDENGEPTCGHWSTARSREEVEFNTAGAIQTAKDSGADFICFQEVDTKSTRSYKINQDTLISEAFPAMNHIHCPNFHTAFLPYPLYDMHGSVHAGLTTLSKFEVEEAGRKEYTVATDFSKFFDLDRCFSYMKIPTSNNKYFYMVNSHMSAYDEGGTIRSAQVAEMNAFLQERKTAGDYVIVAGDFNHDLLTNNPAFAYDSTHRPFGETKKSPDWVSFYFDENKQSPLIDGYHVVASDNYPTCRNNDIEWIPGKTFTCVVDGFIVSDNITVISHQNIQTKNGKKGLDGFAFADHDPALIEFGLS